MSHAQTLAAVDASHEDRAPRFRAKQDWWQQRRPHNLCMAMEQMQGLSKSCMICHAMIEPQLEEARRFWQNPQIRTALLVPWAEAVTAAFFTPIYPYFLTNIGMSPSQMGQAKTVALVLQACSAPIAGILLDAYGPWLGIALPSSVCAIGCLVKAASTGYGGIIAGNVFSGLSGAKQDMSIAHLSRHTIPSRRTLAVSAARVQLQALALLGTIGFTPLNALLTLLLPEAAFGMLRFRVLISSCSIGCGFGVIVLLLHRDALSFDTIAEDKSGANRKDRNAVDEAGEAAEKGPICDATESDGSCTPPLTRGGIAYGSAGNDESLAALETTETVVGTHGRCGGVFDRSPLVLVLALLGLLLCKTLTETFSLTWPLFIQRHFGWTEREYGLLLVVQQALAFTLVAAPTIQHRLGTSRAIMLFGTLSALPYTTGYLLQSATLLAQGMHVVCMLLGFVANLALELVLTALCSNFVAPSVQGRLFAMLAIMRYAGSITGNLAGAALYERSSEMTNVPLPMRGGALPSTVLAPLAFFNAFLLSRCMHNARNASWEVPIPI